MPTGARRRKPVDVQRISDAVSRPGIDPRVWVSGARIEDSSEAIRWENSYGWVVEVVFYGSGLDGELGTARVASPGPTGDGLGEFVPPRQGAEVLVALPDGESGASVVLGTLRNSADAVAPGLINGLPINGEALASTLRTVSPWDTEIKRSIHSRREQYDGALVSQASAVSLVAPAVNLGSEAPEHSAVLGETLLENTETLLKGLDAMAKSFAAMTGPLAPFQAIGTALATAIEQVRLAADGALSKCVKLD